MNYVVTFASALRHLTGIQRLIIFLRIYNVAAAGTMIVSASFYTHSQIAVATKLILCGSYIWYYGSWLLDHMIVIFKVSSCFKLS